MFCPESWQCPVSPALSPAAPHGPLLSALLSYSLALEEEVSALFSKEHWFFLKLLMQFQGEM